MGPAVLGVSAAQISALINTQLASTLGDGRISWITYADRLMEFPSALLGVALGTVLLPSLAKSHADENPAQYTALLDWGLRLAFMLALPAAVALWVLAIPLISTLYQYGRFTVNDVLQTRAALLGYSAGLLGLIVVKILAPGFYARQVMATPVKIAFVTVLVSQTFALILMFPLGHAGLTLSTSIGACLNATLLFWFLKKRGHYVPSAGWLLFVSKLVVALFVLAAVLLWLGGPASFWLSASLWPKVGRLAGVCASGAAAYFGALWLLGFRLADFNRRDAAVGPGGGRRSAVVTLGAAPWPCRGGVSRASREPASTAAALPVRAARLDAFGIEIERVLRDPEAALARHRSLPLLDSRVVELLDAPALQADEMVVVMALVQLEDGLAGLEMMADEKARLLELRQDAIDGRETDVEALVEQLAIDVFRGQVPHLRRLEQVDDLEPRHGCLEAGVLEVAGCGHGRDLRVGVAWGRRADLGISAGSAGRRTDGYNNESSIKFTGTWPRCLRPRVLCRSA